MRTRVRVVTPADRDSWLRMREALWPSESGEHAGEIQRFFTGDLHEPLAVLLAIDESGEAVGCADRIVCFRKDR